MAAHSLDRSPRAVGSLGLVPIDQLGKGTYRGAQGGLYPGGSNVRPTAHDALGLALARSVRPLDAKGRVHPRGRIVLLSIGMSNTSAEFRTLLRLARSDPFRNPRLLLVDGAQPGAGASEIAGVGGRSSRRYWNEIDRRLRAVHAVPEQVQVAWVKAADGYPAGSFPDHALALKENLRRIVQALADRFPNLRLAYCSSRIFAGYASGRLSPEPYAYESGFSVKWLIEDQIDGAADLNFDPARAARRAPWLAWGPYLWADGLATRGDGLRYAPSDFALDGTHPGAGACRKVAQTLLRFLSTDATARRFYRKARSEAARRVNVPGRPGSGARPRPARRPASAGSRPGKPRRGSRRSSPGGRARRGARAAGPRAPLRARSRES
jgi:hypothetical protein